MAIVPLRLLRPIKQYNNKQNIEITNVRQNNIKHSIKQLKKKQKTGHEVNRPGRDPWTPHPFNVQVPHSHAY